LIVFPWSIPFVHGPSESVTENVRLACENSELTTENEQLSASLADLDEA
jgi:hypothetical protein